MKACFNSWPLKANSCLRLPSLKLASRKLMLRRNDSFSFSFPLDQAPGKEQGFSISTFATFPAWPTLVMKNVRRNSIQISWFEGGSQTFQHEACPCFGLPLAFLFSLASSHKEQCAVEQRADISLSN